MTAKLTEITTQYHMFVDNQVLTKDQLNGFINYFEDQDRLSRILLTGVGIVCGFNLKFNATDKSVIISQGVGITTDGDLISLQQNIPLSRNKSITLSEVKFTHARKFEDKFADYQYLKRTQVSGSSVKQVPFDMWELLASSEENAVPANAVGNIDKKVVVLYLESYPKPADVCTVIDCDSQGIEQVARLRVLLLSKDDAALMAQNDAIFSKHNVVASYNSLPALSVPRVILTPLNTSDYESLKRAYHTAITSDNLLVRLETGVRAILSDFEPLLNLKLHRSTLTILLSQLNRILNFGAFSVPSDFQYRYDFLKDLVDTYHEIRSLLLSLTTECFPDIGAFPKHLLLGSIDAIDSDILSYRHKFYKSPALSCGGEKIEQCRNLISRMMLMINTYGANPGQVRITPSIKLADLSQRAIPFYFKVDQTLLKNWDFSKTQKFAAGTNLSYHRTNLSALSHIQEPLSFNTDRFDFYRIEGHQGKNWKTALDEIVGLKQKFGLAFDVKAVSVNINRESLNLDEYECEFEDLNVLLKAWTAEQECILAEVSSFFSGFSLKEPGLNIKTPIVATNLIRERDISVLAGSTPKIETSFEKANDFVLKDSLIMQPEVYKSPTLIQDNLTLTEDALGTVLVNALKDSESKSVNDVIASAKELLTPVLVREVWQTQPDLKKLVIDDSVEILAWSNELIKRMPNVLVDFSDVKVESYKLTLNQLCIRVQRMKSSYQTSRLSESLKAVMALLINQLANVCCSGKKLEVLFSEINKRKESILVRLQLSKFAEQHPGLEHKAGVEPGGTFVLVYFNRVNTRPVTGQVASLSRISALLDQSEIATTKVTSLRVDELEGLLAIAKKEKVSEDELIRLEKLILSDRISLAGRVVETINVPDNTVVADFSLPYMCCSGCAPVNFIVQRPPVRLIFDRDMICLGTNTDPVKYEVTPSDGEIKAEFDVPGMTISLGQMAFEPELFPAELLGRPIRFTVNQQVSEAQLTVHKAIQADFTIVESPAAVNLFSFIPSGDIEGATFLWEFGDGSQPSTLQNPQHRYSVPVNEENKVTVKLTVTAPNGTCKATASHDIVFEEIEVRINIVPLDFCANDRRGTLFTVTPQGVPVTITGPGVNPLRVGGFEFVPALAGVGVHTFTVNGKPSGLTVTVHQPPVARFSPQQAGNQLVITNQSTGATKFIWEINGQKIESPDLSPLRFELGTNTPTSWTIQLSAFSDHCGVDTTPTEKFETTINDNNLRKCLNDTRVLIQRDLRTLLRLNLVGSNFVVPVWEATSNLYGGTDKFNEGVIDDMDNFLTGRHNARLPEMFAQLINQTGNMIIELSRNRQSPEFINLVNLLAHQLRLFYNILACQTRDEILKSESEILKMLETIVAVLSGLRDARVELPDTMRTFFRQWSAQIVGIEILENHVGIISDNNLL